MQIRHHADILSLSAAAILCVGLVSTGCQSAGPVATGEIEEVQPLDLTSSTEGEALDGESAAAQIAAQFEQDMADLQTMRANPQTAQASRPDDWPTPRIKRSDRPQVQFDTPDRLATATDASAQETWNPKDPFDRLPAEDEELTTVATAPPEVRMREAMVNLRRELYQNAAYASDPLRQYLVVTALTMLYPDRTIDPTALPDLTPAEQNLLAAYQSFFTSLGRELHETGDQSKLVGLIDELRSALVDEPDLAVARAELCTRVDGFGNFEPFSANKFLAGAIQDVVIYTEIEDFTSELNDQNQWVTELWQELVIYNSHDNIPVWRQPWQAAPDKSERQRTDFFISYIVSLPERLTVGQYTLKIRVRDGKSGAEAETGIPFQIVAQAELTWRGE